MCSVRASAWCVCVLCGDGEQREGVACALSLEEEVVVLSRAHSARKMSLSLGDGDVDGVVGS